MDTPHRHVCKIADCLRETGFGQVAGQPAPPRHRHGLHIDKIWGHQIALCQPDPRRSTLGPIVANGDGQHRGVNDDQLV